MFSVPTLLGDSWQALLLSLGGERVLEVCRHKGPRIHGGRKTDLLDALRTAVKTLSTEHLIQPRARRKRARTLFLWAEAAAAKGSDWRNVAWLSQEMAMEPMQVPGRVTDLASGRQ
ncbi:hypothetical protein [Streptomyces sp. Inha503]|uniref:hypothetical protein n=1 Tax=Streptomyces sp. Inha503 TaxID=3383314 RepID=UPI0039A39D3E